MRLLRLSTNYPAYLEQFCRHRDLSGHCYADQYNMLMQDRYGWSDSWTATLSSYGYEVWEPVANAEILQKTWAREHGIVFDDRNWFKEIVAAQVIRYKPDILFVTDYLSFTPDFIRELRCKVPSIRLVVAWCGAPYESEGNFRVYDLILSNIPEHVSRFRSAGLCAEHLAHAFDERVLGSIGATVDKQIDFSFIGSIVKCNSYHTERERLILALVEKTPLRLWIDSPRASSRERILLPFHKLLYLLARFARVSAYSERFLSDMPVIKRYAYLPAPPDLSHYLDLRLAVVSAAPVFALEMFRTLAASRVTLNTHIDISAASASNMRLFEATGVGTCLLTEWKPNLGELFVPDTEVVTYRSLDEAVEKVAYLLAHESERRAIAAAGQRRTLACHTIVHRAPLLDAIFRQRLLEL